MNNSLNSFQTTSIINFDVLVSLDFRSHISLNFENSNISILKFKTYEINETYLNVEKDDVSSLFFNIDKYRRRFQFEQNHSTTSQKDTHRSEVLASINMMNIFILKFWETLKENVRRFLRIIDLNFMTQTQFIEEDLKIAKCLVFEDKCKEVTNAWVSR